MIIPERSYLDKIIKEDEVLSTIEQSIRERQRFDLQHLENLNKARQSLPTPVGNVSTSHLQSRFVQQLDQEIEELSKKIETTKKALTSLIILTTTKWDVFRSYIEKVKKVEAEHDDVKQYAMEGLPSLKDEFLRQVGSAESWLDFRLPAEDLAYRAAVSMLNSVKDQAFEFYQKEQQNLKDEHERRLTALEMLVPGALPQSSTPWSPPMSPMELSSPVSGAYVDNGNSSGSGNVDNNNGNNVVGSPRSDRYDMESIESIRGPFAAVKYTNYLFNEKEGYAVFGTSITCKSGKLGKHIVQKNDMYSPPPPIFVEANCGPETNHEYLERVWTLEEQWASKDSIHTALKEAISGGYGRSVMDKGWLLGFILVNLPTPLIPLSESQLKRYGGGAPRRSFGSLLRPGTSEHDFFSKLWSLTNGINIKAGAVAITQAKNTEQLLSDIRSKWQIEVNKPLPLHRKWVSEDEGSGKRRLSLGMSSRNNTGDH